MANGTGSGLLDKYHYIVSFKKDYFLPKKGLKKAYNLFFDALAGGLRPMAGLEKAVKEEKDAMDDWGRKAIEASVNNLINADENKRTYENIYHLYTNYELDKEIIKKITDFADNNRREVNIFEKI